MSYEAQRALAYRLISRRGQTATFLRTIPGTPGADDRPATPPSSIVAVTKVVVLPISDKALGMADTFVEKTLIQQSMRNLLIAVLNMTVTGGATYEPREGDTVGVIEGKTWRIVGARPLNPDSQRPVFHRAVIKA